MKRCILVSLLCFATASTALAQVTVRDPWVRATVPAQTATGAFMQISAAKGARLVEVRTPMASMAEIHAMTMVDNVMRMRAVPGIDLPAGKAVALEPGGYHVMLMGLKGRVKEGDTVPLTLIVMNKDGKRESVEVKAVARPLTATMSKGRHHQ